MTKQNETMLKVVEEAKEVGIKVVYEYRGRNVKMTFYIDDPKKLNEDCFYLDDKGKAVIFKKNRGDLIGVSGVSYWSENNIYPDHFDVTDRYLSILPGIESEDDYIDEDDYDARFMDAGEVQPIRLCDSLIWYTRAKLDDYTGEFWQFIHPSLNYDNEFR